jgi:hypothetical protein
LLEQKVQEEERKMLEEISQQIQKQDQEKKAKEATEKTKLRNELERLVLQKKVILLLCLFHGLLSVFLNHFRDTDDFFYPQAEIQAQQEKDSEMYEKATAWQRRKNALLALKASKDSQRKS